jgi:hypothetical protein
MRKVLFFSLLVVVWIFVFFPKTILWNYFVDEMDKRDISVVAKEVDMRIWLLHNEIDIKNLTLLQVFTADSLKIKQNILKPLHVEFKGISEHGEFDGVVGLKDRNGSVVFRGTDLSRAIFRSYFKQYEDGMKYEFAF